MLVDLYRLLPLEGVKILLVLFPSFVTGLEREERQTGTDRLLVRWRSTLFLNWPHWPRRASVGEGQILTVILVFAVVGGLPDAVLG